MWRENRRTSLYHSEARIPGGHFQEVSESFFKHVQSSLLPRCFDPADANSPIPIREGLKVFPSRRALFEQAENVGGNDEWFIHPGLNLRETRGRHRPRANQPARSFLIRLGEVALRAVPGSEALRNVSGVDLLDDAVDPAKQSASSTASL